MPLSLHDRAGLTVCCALLAMAVSTRSGAQSTGSNGIYDVAVDATGEFTARTGPSHPGPVGANVLYNGDVLLPRTSFNSVRSYGTATEYALRETLPGASAGFTCRRIASVAAPVIEPLSDGVQTTGVRHTWSIANGEDLFDIVQEVNAEGSGFDDSVVRVTLCLQNDGGTALEAGVRFLWDWQIGEQDGAYVGLHPPSPPTEPYLDTEMDWAPPSFTFYEASDQQSPSVTPPLYRIGGTVNGPELAPPPSPPELLQFISWPDSYPTCFNASTASRVIGAADSAISYYWGATPGTALVVPPGESVCLTQYLFVYTDRPPALCDLVARLAGGAACAPETVTLDASASEGPDCAGALEYRFFDPEGRLARDWSTEPTADADFAGTWTVEVRCSDSPGCTATDSAEAVVTDVSAALAGGTACLPAAVTLDASASSAQGCDGGLEYRFLRPDGTPARDWAVDAQAPADETGTWTVEVRCAAVPGCVSSTTAEAVLVDVAAALSGGAACGPDAVTLDASASTETDCTGGLEYRFRDPLGAVARDWSAEPTADAGAGGAWSVDVRCASLPDCLSSETADVEIVTVTADLAGGEGCGAAGVDLDASGSTADGCDSGLEYLFRDPSGAVARDWATDPTAPADAEGTWTVEVRCASRPGCTSSDTAPVGLTEVTAVLDAAAGCAPGDGSLDASASASTGCPGGLEFRFLDPTGAVARDWSPDPSAPAGAAGTWALEARCADRPDCTSSDSDVVAIEEPPAEFAVLATDLDPCNPGLLLQWPGDWAGAAWGTNGAGTFAVHRSETSCEDALARPPIASGLTEPRFEDRTGLDGRPYWYAVVAEAATAAEGCPGGPERGAPFTTACIDSPATDLVVPPPPESIGAALRVRRPEASPVLEWTLGPALRPFETDLVRRSLDPQNLTLLVDGILERSYQDDAAVGTLLFYKVYRRNGCGDVSDD